MDEQPRLSDLVPLRLPVFLIPLILGGAIIAGLEALYAWMPSLASMTTDGRIAAFDLDGEGSLAVWFSTMTLSGAGLVALLVYTVRRHKVDDYHGQYRVWLWAAMCWFLMGLDETASLHEGFKEMMAVISGTRIFGDGSIWWVIPYFFLLGAVGTRLLVDMRSCLLSSTAFVLTAICYAVGVLAQLGWIMPESGARGVMLEEGAEMLGNLMLLLAMALHARHVIMDALGLLPRPIEYSPEPEESLAEETPDEAEEREETEETEDESNFAEVNDQESAVARKITVHPPHGSDRLSPRSARPTPQPPSSPRAKGKSVPQSMSLEEDAEEDACQEPSVHRKLTKEERKALRKRLEKMKRQRDRQR